MDTIVLPVAKSFRYTDFSMNLVTSDLTNEQAIYRIRQSEGPSISWIIGHLCGYRLRALRLLGHEHQGEFEEQCVVESATDGAGYPDIEQIKERWNEVAGLLADALQEITEEQMLAPQPDRNGEPGKGQRLLDLFAFYTWHEAYHMGSLGMVRKELGRPSGSELAVVAAGKNTT